MVAAAAQQLLLVLGDLVGGGGPVEAAGVDPERVGADPGLAAVVEDGPALVVDLELHQLAAAVEEVAAVGGRVEADDVVGEQAAVDLLAPASSAAIRHESGCDQGMWTKCWRKTSGRASADQGGAGVEVVVVEHHQRLLVVGDRPHHGFGDIVVDDLVAVLPRVELLLANVGRVREVPEVVLDEPQNRVRDHVVEAVVGVGVGFDQADVVLDVVDLERDRAPARLAGDGGILLGHRRGDPEGPAMADEPGQRGDEAAAAPLDDTFAVRTALVLSRAAIGDDDQPLLRHGPGSKPPVR